MQSNKAIYFQYALQIMETKITEAKRNSNIQKNHHFFHLVKNSQMI